MHKQWNVNIRNKEEVTVYVMAEDDILYSYDYDYDAYADEAENADNCVEEFLEQNDALTLSDEEVCELEKYLEHEFIKNDLSDADDYKWNWGRQKGKADDEFTHALKNNSCYYSQYAIDKCMERVNKEQTLLVPGEDGIPKNINIITANGDKYYARISCIKVLQQCTSLDFENAFTKHSVGIAIVAFETRNKQNILCLELEFAHESTDERNIKFYRFNKNKTIDFGGNIDATVYSISDSSIYIHSASELAEDLTPALSYYSTKLDEINQHAETTKILVDLQLLRENYNSFENLIVDKDLLIIPIKGTAFRLNGISVLVEDYNGTKTKYDFYEGRLAPLSKDEKDNYKEILTELDVQLPKGTDLAVLDFVELSDKDIYLFNSILTDAENYSCTIINNIEGDKARLNRIIRSIENALNGNVVNHNLVKTICKNSITFSCDPNLSYIPNEEYIERLKSEYPILSTNIEQISAVDKVMQMDSRNIDIMLIQGPPGTGKTELILALAKELSKTKNNTLITSNVHVACDNIVERLKNNKDLVLKRYTTVKGEQYAKEVIENKRKYIENQVLEGFRYKDYIIDSEKSYAGLKGETEALIRRKMTMIDSKAKYDEEIREYNDLLSESKSLADAQNDIKKLIEQDKILIEDNKKQHDNAVADLSSNELEISKQKEAYLKLSSKTTADEQEYSAKTDELNALYNQVSQKESILSNTTQEISAIKEQIEFINAEIQRLEDTKQNLEKFDVDLFKKDVLTLIVDGKPLNNAYYKMIIGNSVRKAQEIFEIYQKLRSDAEFWNGTKTSLSTIEYLYFRQKKNPLSLKSIDSDAISRIGDLYDYLRSSKIKRTMMSIFPFIKTKGKNQAYYVALQDAINKELKKIQFNLDDYIYEYIHEDMPESKIENLLIETSEKIKSYLTKQNALKEQLEASKSLLENLNEDIESLQKEIPRKTKALLRKKTTVQNDKEELDAMSCSLDTAENRSKELQCIISDLSKECAKIEQDVTDHGVALESNEKEIVRNRNDIFAIYNEKKELIENYDAFIKKLDIDIKNIEKDIAEHSIVITRIEKKVEELEICGFTKEEAFELIFDYSNELNKIVNSKDENIGHYINGQCNEFNQIFLLNERSDGSLISMTTNQIASLLNNADNRDLNFDYAIIDEASKCSFEDIIISLPRIKHLVLIGDFMQLDHMYDQYSKIDLQYQNMFTINQWEALNKSSFSLLLSQFVEYNELNSIESFDSNPYVAVMKRQYRMNRDIYQLIEPIYAIHKGFELIDEKQLTANDLKCIAIDGREMQPPQGSSFYNMQEGDAIVSFLKEFSVNRAQYPKIKTIGIITGYKAQENYIRRKLKSISVQGVQIGTFDRFQGREYDLVIVSLVRTDRLGFTSNVRRMNVAFSRAKNHLLIYGNFEALNKIAMKSSKIDDDLSNNDIKENTFVAKVLIPTLYKLSKKDGLKENIVSEKERVESTMDFLKDNAYGQ